MANGYSHNVALLNWEHTEHIAHVRHIEHVDYQIFLTDLARANTKPISAVQQVPSSVPKISPAPSIPVSTTTAPGPLSYYSCASLESLWISAGGNPSDAFIAAEIATAESGGNPDAISPTDDFGLWQINGSWGAMASLNPWTNVHSAITISNNGTNWSPWTTFTSGAYIGRCG